jgi:hypothetical protein
LGLGTFASVQLATDAIRGFLGSSIAGTLDFATMATYHCCVLIWLFYLLAPEREARRLAGLPATDLQQWNQELQRLLQQ